ncbi:MAG: hypothetical protein ACFFE2_10545 [Candidatus Thorarchaeota archaeon]
MEPDEKEVKRIECQSDGDVMTLGKDELVSYRFFRHGSVGENMEFEIGDESILKYLRTETEYIHPEKMKYHDWTGGDAEKGLWFFQTVGTGKTTLAVSKVFRGTLESKCTLHIVVK